MRLMLNRQFPFDAIARWWYVLAGGFALGLIFSLVTDFNLLRPFPKLIFIVEGPPSHIQNIGLVLQQSWKENVLFAILGFLLASGITWLLEEIRAYNRVIHQG